MSRPRIPLGTFGEITCQEMPSGHVRARALYRDWDGHARQVQASGPTKAAAERVLKAKLSARDLLQPGVPAEVTADSTFARLADYWLADIELEDRLAKQTRDRYAYHLRQPVLPAFADLTLREIGVARCDLFIKQMAKQSYNKARQAKVILRSVFGLAVRHEILPRNPMDGIARLHKPPHTPTPSRPPRSTRSGWPSDSGRPAWPRPAPSRTASCRPSSRSCWARPPASEKPWPCAAGTST